MLLWYLYSMYTSIAVHVLIVASSSTVLEHVLRPYCNIYNHRYPGKLCVRIWKQISTRFPAFNILYPVPAV
ncbi:hypothetical protein BJX65DRAFT_262092 [Aspergillus insuetus]